MKKRCKRSLMGISMSFVLSLISFLVIGLCADNTARAQEKGYPGKPIKVMVPFGGGSVSDLAARVMIEQLSRELGVPLIVENKEGAGGMIGSNEVLKAKPDGYTLLAAAETVLTLSPAMSPNPPYDPYSDFLPVCAYGVTAVSFGVLGSSPIKTLPDLVKAAKEAPGKITVAVPAIGNEDHLLYEIFKKASGVNMKLIPYKNPAEGIAALLGKHVDMMSLSYVAFLPYVRSGEVRLIAATSAIPGSSIPTFTESGYPQAMLPRVMAFFVSAKTPRPIYEKLVQVFERVAKNPEIVGRWENIGIFPNFTSPAEFSLFIKKKGDTYLKLTEELGLRGKSERAH